MYSSTCNRKIMTFNLQTVTLYSVTTTFCARNKLSEILVQYTSMYDKQNVEH